MIEEEPKISQVQPMETPSSRPSDVSAPDLKKTQKGQKSKLMKIIFILAIIALLVGGGWFLLREPQFDEETLETDGLSAPEVTETPTPIPQEVNELLEREKVSIEILNGTGIAKEASYLQKKLEDLGYSKIDLGNVDKQDYEVAFVTFSSSLDGKIVAEITQELKGIYNDVNSKTSDGLEVDVQIITGLRAGQSLPTSTPTPASTLTPTSSPSATPTL